MGPRGDIAWMCAPGWDSDAVFAALIGGDGWYTVTHSVVRVGRLLRTGQPDRAQPVDHHRRAARPSPTPGTRTGRWCCAGSRPSTATPTSTCS
ncbi:trehalase-like domain-containing protein [Kitasatospora sp. NPDC058190]|uniref:trehalase-like domain-containing protein n=1 Tax=Kitasatospora sp. NPDC058190 TaxID=3346371 RepID=UPI0036DECBE3